MAAVSDSNITEVKVEEHANAQNLNRENKFVNLTAVKIKIGINNKRYNMVENNRGKHMTDVWKNSSLVYVKKILIAWNIINWFLAGPSIKDAKFAATHSKMDHCGNRKAQGYSSLIKHINTCPYSRSTSGSQNKQISVAKFLYKKTAQPLK